MKTAIGTAMLELMREHEIDRVMWGDAWLLDTAFSKSGSQAKVRHPLNRWQTVLNALSKDSRFEKHFIKIDLWINGCYRDRFVRCFKPKE